MHKKIRRKKKLATEIVESAKADVDSVKQKLLLQLILILLLKNLNEMMKVEIVKTAKKQVVTEVLEELLSSDNIKLTQNELVNIVLKR